MSVLLTDVQRLMKNAAGAEPGAPSCEQGNQVLESASSLLTDVQRLMKNAAGAEPGAPSCEQGNQAPLESAFSLAFSIGLDRFQGYLVHLQNVCKLVGTF